ncbi:dihydrolipoyl dehydrogenase family protein [Leucobacter sp. M11]|uniref:dihydrolipoyl dehydrogenase family protein n=1 Tax=Leucobacter sp. M11 TaxID=2993565 RepID=UPI002D80067E|nr:NAD(P)/FAD-dependent oxidoreductase [Leucobacter sp. M11]MEB4615121.1 NAD(P)/FAD-dependent oxidoreductase [Leucobacter sp. M11]
MSEPKPEQRHPEGGRAESPRAESRKPDADVIIIGGGPVGENAADRVVQGGLTAVIVEHELVGGECSYWACMPTKALLRSGAALAAAQRVPGAAEAVTGRLNRAAVLARRDDFAANWSDDGQVDWVRDAGIDLVRGHGSVLGERRVLVTAPDGTTRELLARHAVVLATGSTASLPDIPGLAEAEPWTSREAASADEIPEHLVILGGGVVASEFATAYRSLGARVTLIARSGLLGGFEPFAGDLVAQQLRDSGAEVILGAEVARVARDARGVRVETSAGRVVEGTEVLVALGRTPAVAGLGLGALGLPDEAAPGPVPTEETLRVPGLPWLYAIGDVTGRAPLTHQGKYQGRAAGDVIVARATGAPVDAEAWGVHAATADARARTQVVFTDPEVASVGLTEAAAQADRPGGVRVVDADFDSVAGASLHADGYRGRARLVVDEATETVLGATFVGQDVAELAQSAAIAIVGEVPLRRLWHAVPAYPTLSEVWLRLLEADGRPEAAAGTAPGAAAGPATGA